MHTNSVGETPLFLAAMQGFDDCVRLLLHAPGIQPDKADIHGKTPLHIAVEKRHDECIRLLRQAAHKSN